MPDTNDFYEDDEPIKDLRAAWRRGEKGVTSGPRDLNQRAKSIVDRAVDRWDSDDAVEASVTISGNAFSVSSFRAEPPAVVLPSRR